MRFITVTFSSPHSHKLKIIVQCFRECIFGLFFYLLKVGRGIKTAITTKAVKKSLASI